MTQRPGFDLTMQRERDGYTCTIYRTGKNTPLRRKLVKTEEAGIRWFERQIKEMVK